MNVKSFNGAVPHNINRIIAEKGLKKQSVATRAGYSAQQFYAMTTGRKIIKINDVVAIAAALEIPVAKLFEDCR